jgi:hypothetical protein
VKNYFYEKGLMNIIGWCYDHIIGPDVPSKEVREYVKRELKNISRIEKLLDSQELDALTQDRWRHLIYEKRRTIKVFERMYPGLISKVS